MKLVLYLILPLAVLSLLAQQSSSPRITPELVGDL
ncbi:MAG: hypothetical protein JWP63_3279, partial [Candidatus Solibacter sp.]|nr:hypothetical protein [Candidatus Solibacter sp.]